MIKTQNVFPSHIKIRRSTRDVNTLPKAIEYKVGPYGLLFSWYTLSIRDGNDIFAYLWTGETSGID